MSEFAVIFDSDGVILDTERLARQAFAEVTLENGFPYEDSHYLAFAGLTDTDLLDAVGQFYETPAPGRTFLDDQNGRYERMAAETPPEPIRDVERALASLEAGGVPMALATSASPEKVALNYRERQDIYRFFRAVVTEADVSRGKPDPEIFRTAAKALGYSPEACLVVEDTPNGVAAAKAAGCRAIAVATTFDPPRLTSADVILGSFQRFSIPLLRALMAPA